VRMLCLIAMNKASFYLNADGTYENHNNVCSFS
jgi:hypothetical protein